MGWLRALQAIRHPALDAVFLSVTLLGEETFFTVLGLIFYWCIHKKWGLRILIAGLAGTVLNQLLKAIFVVPRPWVIDPAFTIVEAAREAATGYSFPSGHTQSAATLFGMLALWSRHRGTKALCIFAALLVGFSRMYLGVHTPWDVGVSLLTGALTVLCVNALMQRYEDSPRGTLLLGGGLFLFALVLLAFVLLVPERTGSMPEFDAHGVENAWKLVGTTAGVVAAWQIDTRRTHFPVKAVWWAQVIKCAVGIALTLGVRAGLKPVLYALLGGNPLAGGIRYFCVALGAGGLWPMTFGGFSRLGSVERSGRE